MEEGFSPIPPIHYQNKGFLCIILVNLPVQTYNEPMNKTKSGFTIVELLIVIVVIGILAAITVVAYSGIQARAENSKTVSAVQAYKKALLHYAIDNGSYPTIGARCLGDTYPATDGTTTGCRDSLNVLPNSNGTAMINALKPYLNNAFPLPSTKILFSSTGRGYVGAYFYGDNYGYTLNGSPVIALIYTIESNKCPVGPVYTTSGAPAFTNSHVADYSATISSSASTCWILLPAALQL